MMFLQTLARMFYGAIVTLRNALYDRRILSVHRVALPVISVGNITAGGNGKTPLCISIAEHYTRKGHRPVILTRGYGGTLRGPVVVSHAHTPREVGDEPVLLARRGFTVIVARDRVEGALICQEHSLGDVIILDDGFQHRRLWRDLDIVTVDVGSPEAGERFAQGKLLPDGRFREPRDAALSRASCIVLSSRGNPSAQTTVQSSVQKHIPSHIPTFFSTLESREYSLIEGVNAPLVPPEEIVAFCAIANPDPFFASLTSRGFRCSAQKAFPDHYFYTPHDIENLLAIAGDRPLVCTEKDAVKLEKLLPKRGRWYVVSVSSIITPEATFSEFLDSVFA